MPVPLTKSELDARNRTYFENDIVLEGSTPVWAGRLVKKLDKRTWTIRYFGTEQTKRTTEKLFFAMHVNDFVLEPRTQVEDFRRGIVEAKRLLAQMEGGWGSKAGRHKKINGIIARSDENANRDVVAAGGIPQSPELVRALIEARMVGSSIALPSNNEVKTNEPTKSSKKNKKQAEVQKPVNRKRNAGEATDVATTSSSKKTRSEKATDHSPQEHLSRSMDRTRSRTSRTSGLGQRKPSIVEESDHSEERAEPAAKKKVVEKPSEAQQNGSTQQEPSGSSDSSMGGFFGSMTNKVMKWWGGK